MDAQRAMLDELMGKERNVPLTERTGRALKFSDPEICKYNLAGLCPYGLFRNTRSDLGPCKYEMHDDDLQYEPVLEQWQQLTDHERERYGYEQELHSVLVQLVKEMDRKIERQKERANKEAEPRKLAEKEREQLDAIKARQKEASEKSERLAEDADVDGSEMFAKQAEAFARQHDNLCKQFMQPERTMTVCEVCGVFINSTDNDQRRADHLAGKQYLGWLAIREKLTELNEKRKALPPPPPAGLTSRPSSGRPSDADDRRRRDRDPEPDRHRRDSDRHRDRDRERDYRDRDRDRDRDRHRDRDRERSHTSDGRRRSEYAPPSDLYRSGSSSRRHDSHSDKRRREY
ncbi:hypothetical protein WJX73_003841 [Symbiochloris irregularis]|uniref:Luc7-like protein 3 n=1 Tax=Symbiochloris irregularis TaxID=706552 RepID=A0AAW1NMA5_9CHLO